MSASEGAMSASVPPPLPAAAVSAPDRVPGSPLTGFAIDLGMAMGLLLMLSTLLSIGVALVTGLSALARGEILDIDTLLQSMTQPGGMAMIWLTLLSTGGAAVCVYLLRDKATAAQRQASREACTRASTWGWAVLVGLGTLATSSLIGWLGQQAGSQPEPTNEAMIRGAFDQSPVFMFLFAALLAPAYEELLFRRVLFGRLWRAGRPWLGMALSSTAFALIHELPGLSDNSVPATLQLWLTYGLMGAAFAWVYRRTGSLWAAIAAHALNNAIACALMLLGYA